MSAAQKAAQANFKKAIAYRKKTGCTLKQAFAHVKGGKVSGLDKVIKSGNKTTVLYTKKAKKKAAPKKKTSQGVLFGTKKKKAAPKKAVVRNYGSHKDTASHNVKISVMSGLPIYRTAVRVFFKNPKYNFTTTVSNHVTEESAKEYYVNKLFNVGTYPKEVLQKCIRIKLFKYLDK